MNPTTEKLDLVPRKPGESDAAYLNRCDRELEAQINKSLWRRLWERLPSKGSFLR